MNTNRSTITGFARPLLLGAAVLALAGCGSLLGGSPRQPVTIYAPQPQVQPDPAWPQAQWQLAITTTSSSRAVEIPRIAVRPVPTELQVYRGATWAQPPAGMVETAVLAGFENSGRIGAVARSETGLRPDYRLILDVRRFEADYAGQAAPGATIEVVAKLLHSREQRVVASRTFTRVHPAGGTAVPQVVVAFEQALGAVVTDIVGWTLSNGEADTGTR